MVNGIHFIGFSPDPDIIWSKQGDGFSEESLKWLDKKLDEIDPDGTEIIFLNCHYPIDNRYENEDGTVRLGNHSLNTKILTPVLKGHPNLFHFFGHWESYYHDYSSRAVIHYNAAGQPINGNGRGTETDSNRVLVAKNRGFTGVNMGHFRPMYNGQEDMFENDYVIGSGGYAGSRFSHGSTCTPKCGQGMYVVVYEDRIEFTMKNIGTYEGLSTEDILKPYTVWLYQG